MRKLAGGDKAAQASPCMQPRPATPPGSSEEYLVLPQRRFHRPEDKMAEPRLDPSPDRAPATPWTPAQPSRHLRTGDEQMVNMALILLLHALVADQDHLSAKH